MNLTKIAEAVETVAGDNEFHHHTFRKHKGKYFIYKGHYKPVGEGYNSYSEMLPEYLKTVKK